MARQLESRYGIKYTDRDLKRIGRDALADHLQAECERKIAEIDLSEGAKYLAPDWGARSICDWVNRKFLVSLKPEDIAELPVSAIVAKIRGLVREAYRRKEVEFPVAAAVNTFLNDKPQANGPARLDRAGMYAFMRFRFPAFAEEIREDDFRTLPRSRIIDVVMDIARRAMPEQGQELIGERVRAAFEGTAKSDADDARELADWFRGAFGIEIPVADLTGVSAEVATQRLWNAFDDRYRPEMRNLERSVLLGRLDDAWKKHLLTMDHLRSGIGLVSYAQVDPKTEYKREGMKAFDEMWASLEDRITDAVFRMEEEEGFQEVTFTTVHEAAPRFEAPAAQPQSDMATNSSTAGEKRPEPIRNSKDRVGRNDPCPCGSGKKYKNCHMKSEPVKR
jgi:preprotein translocase subunit SecA